MIRVAAITWLTASVDAAQEHGCLANEIHLSGTNYLDPDYGYSLDLPQHSEACRIKPPAPQHGLTVRWTGGSNGAIRFYAEYDVLMLGSAKRLARHTAEAFSHAHQLAVTKDQQAEIAGLGGSDVVLHGDDHRGGVNYIHFLLAYRPITGGVGIVYTVVLQSRVKNTRDEELLSKIAASLQLLPIGQ